jgi:pilus assembly protein Flp/PilA
MKRFLRDEKGATAIEYALIAAIVSIVIVGGATMIGTGLNSSFNQVSSGFSSR